MLWGLCLVVLGVIAAAQTCTRQVPLYNPVYGIYIGNISSIDPSTCAFYLNSSLVGAVQLAAPNICSASLSNYINYFVISHQGLDTDVYMHISCLPVSNLLPFPSFLSSSVAAWSIVATPNQFNNYVVMDLSPNQVTISPVTTDIILPSTSIHAATCVASGNPVPANLISGGQGKRSVETSPVCVLGGGTISFSILPIGDTLCTAPLPYGVLLPGSPIKISFQFAVGSTWQTIVEMNLTARVTADYLVTIPNSARSQNTQFRWIQDTSGFQGSTSEALWSFELHSLNRTVSVNTCQCNTCSNQGVCVFNGTNGVCQCYYGYTGADCSTPDSGSPNASLANPFLIVLSVCIIITCCLLVVIRLSAMHREEQRNEQQEQLLYRLRSESDGLEEGGAHRQWACEECTFLNNNELITCEICGTMRPGALLAMANNLPPEIVALYTVLPLHEDQRKREDPAALDRMFFSGMFQSRWEFLEKHASNERWARLLDSELSLKWTLKSLPQRNRKDGDDCSVSTEGVGEENQVLLTRSTSEKLQESRNMHNFISLYGQNDDLSAKLRLPQENDGWINSFDQSKGITWIPAVNVSMPLHTKQSKLNLDYPTLVSVSKLSLGYKDQWLARKLGGLKIDWESGHTDISIRRSCILADSMDIINRLESLDFYKVWRIAFVGEPGRDAGGLMREWYECLTQEIFASELGLFKKSAADPDTYEIHPSSETLCPQGPDIINLLGRLIAKAIIDRQVINIQLCVPLLKLLLEWPFSFSDLYYVDPQLYRQLKELLTTRKDIENLFLDFSVMETRLVPEMKKTVVETDAVVSTSEMFPSDTKEATTSATTPDAAAPLDNTAKEITAAATPKENIYKETVVNIDLIEGGKDIEVTSENIERYTHALLKYYMCDRNKLLLESFLAAFRNILPLEVLSIFDYREVELLLCGLPEIDVVDWKNNTKYEGYYKTNGESNVEIQWFWEVVQELVPQDRATLLQFCTGTTRVPLRGFSVLQGSDGRINLFTITDKASSHESVGLFPEAHTCFNRLHLPRYKSKDELKYYLSLCLRKDMVSGFGLE